jgi:cytochrome c5
MRKFKIIFFFLICLTWTFACHDRLETVKRNEFQSALIFEQKCSQCHDLKRVVTLERDEETWRKIVAAMSKEKGSDISEDEINIIVRYHRQRQKKDRELFETKCSKCHKRMNIQSPPELEKTPDQWKATIRRMMEKTSEVISDENIDTLIYYHIRTHSMIISGKLEAQAKILVLDSSELFERKCSICHSLGKSLHALKDEESWQKTIQAMAKKHGSTITESDISELVNFHVARQKKEQELFLRDCSQCHPAYVALETGKTDEQWRQTARKMMDKAGRKISEEELDILTQYHIRYEKTMAILAMKKCSRCHSRERIFTPMGTAKAWERIIVNMSEKEGSDITPDDVRRLAYYHVAKQKIEQEVFMKDCSKCHEPEETLKEKKSKGEWRQTIRRMMAKTDKMITDEELEVLINYHIRRARYGK